jgi:hypothetical protein
LRRPRADLHPGAADVSGSPFAEGSERTDIAIEFVDLALPDAPVPCAADRGKLLARLHIRDGDTMLFGALAFAAM